MSDREVGLSRGRRGGGGGRGEVGGGGPLTQNIVVGEEEGGGKGMGSNITGRKKLGGEKRKNSRHIPIQRGRERFAEVCQIEGEKTQFQYAKD